MTHIGKPIRESDGKFSAPTETDVMCPNCGRGSVTCETWDSHDGAYEDYKYTCHATGCGHVWWVDGIDA